MPIAFALLLLQGKHQILYHLTSIILHHLGVSNAIVAFFVLKGTALTAACVRLDAKAFIP